MEDNQEFNLDASQRTRLLKMGLYSPTPGDDDVDPDERRMDFLYQILISPLPLPSDVKTTLPDLITGQFEDLVSVSGKPIGELIQDEQTDLLTLRKIKEHSKQQGTEATTKEDKEQGDAFMAVYFAAIASALFFHDAKISHHRDEDMRRFFGLFANKPWVIEELRTLFAKATQITTDSEKTNTNH
jgi:hypothetical protein